MVTMIMILFTTSTERFNDDIYSDLEQCFHTGQISTHDCSKCYGVAVLEEHFTCGDLNQLLFSVRQAKR